MSLPNIKTTEIDETTKVKEDSEQQGQGEPRVTLTHTVKLSNLPAALRSLLELSINDIEDLASNMRDMKVEFSTYSWKENWIQDIDTFRQRLLDLDISLSELHNIFSMYQEYKKNQASQGVSAK